MILQAAGFNQSALDRLGDDDRDPNGLFTRELLKALAIPGLPVRGVMRTVHDAVRERAASRGYRQSPALYDEADGDFVFTPGQAPPRPAVAALVPVPVPPPPPPPPPVSVLRDCPECPEMVLIPAGSFQMGIPEAESQREGTTYWDNHARPVHTVRIGQAFYLGKYHVTRGQYAAFARATGRSVEQPGFSQTDEHPVGNVSWTDAVAYVEWLTQRSGKRYRLPSEAEWEYAARAGTRTARYWGESGDQQCQYANGRDLTANPGGKMPDTVQCSDGFKYKSPVGSFRPNGFGLYDMLGNAWQLVEDCFAENYVSVPSDGSSFETSQCSFRVLRGGSWLNVPEDLRAGHRNWLGPGDGSNGIGFRVLRTLTP